jgi:sugar lactone lactonase YvrE
LSFPNGLAISPDGQMLILVQSGWATVEQCRIAANGALGALRPFARQLGDGLAVEPDGGLWVCDPGGGRGVARYDRAGRLTARVVVDQADTIACAVDPDNQVLYIVGIERLARGADLFEEMAAGRTRGVLWKADLAVL